MGEQVTSGPHAGRRTPLLLYGTAWKTEKTAELTETALTHGFVGVDIANYPTGYDEPLTGQGIAAALASGVERSNLFVQTKFTPLWAHDKDKIPFNPDQSIEGQVRESIQQSFDHLKVDYLDALLLHAPYENQDDNLVAWKVFETFVPHKIRCLGVSNFSLPQLQAIYDNSSVKPVIVQNRFYKDTSYDLTLRAFCKDHCITYQAFWMLKHNPELLESDILSSVAEKLQVEKELAFYILILSLGDVQVLDGTAKSERMEKDVQMATEVMNDELLLKELRPAFAEWCRLLWRLAGLKS